MFVFELLAVILASLGEPVSDRCEVALAPRLLAWEQRLTRVAPWALTPAQDSALARAFEGESSEDDALNYLSVLSEARVRPLNLVSRRLIARSTRDLKAHAVTDPSAEHKDRVAYDYRLNHLVLPVGEMGLRDPAVAHAYVHEREHSVQRNSQVQMVLAWTMSRARRATLPRRVHEDLVLIAWLEAEAIGAQWEWAHRIPRSIRERWIEDIREHKHVVTDWDRDRARVREDVRRTPGYLTMVAELVDRVVSGHSVEVPSRLAEVVSGLVAPNKRSLERDRDVHAVMRANAAIQLGAAERAMLYEIMESGPYGPRSREFLRATAAGDANPPSSPATRIAVDLALDHLRRTWLDIEPSDVRLALNTFLLRTLEHAHLPKAKFVAILVPYHGYDLQTLVNRREAAYRRSRR